MAKRTAQAISDKDIKERIKYAKGLYSSSISKMEEDEDLFTGEYTTAQEVKDLEIEIVKPSRPMAILFKFLARLGTRAEVGIEAVPKALTDAEDTICTTLERWLSGFKFQAEWEAQQAIYRHFVFWFLLRGRGCIEVRLAPEFAEDKEHLAVYPVIDDPKFIFPVYGRRGIIFYAKEYKQTVWSLRQEVEVQGKEYGWKLPTKLADAKGDQEATVQEYWDKNWHAAFVDEEQVYSKENPLGVVPLAEAKAMDTPLSSAEWASQGILRPIGDILKKQAELMSKITTATELFYWPRIIVREPGGRSYMLESTPGTLETIHPEAKIDIIQPVPNQPLVRELNSMLSSDVNLMTLPELAWGMEVTAGVSGYAVSQVLNQILDVIEDKRQNLERALGWHFGQVLKLAEKISPLASDKKLYVMAEPEEEGRKRRDLLGIGEAEISGHYRITVNLAPPLPEDKMARYEIARRAREAGRDGVPLLDDYTILSQVIEISNPDEVKERLEKQIMERTTPEIMEWKRRKYIEEFCKENKINPEELMGQVPGAEGMQQPSGMEQLMGQMQQPGAEMGGPPPQVGGTTLLEEPEAPEEIM